MLRSALFFVTIVGTAAPAAVPKSDDGLVARPREVLQIESQVAADDEDDRQRRQDVLREQTAIHRDRIKGRLRALYKLGNGGSLRLLLSANSMDELSTRSVAVRRLLERDLTELKSLKDELAELDGEKNHPADEHSGKLGSAFAPSGNQLVHGKLGRPVQGAVAAPFGPFFDTELKVERSRRGIELKAHPKEIVHAPFAGTVAWVGQIPGIGFGMAIDHGVGFITLVGRLSSPCVSVGDVVRAGDPIGEVNKPTLYFELTQGGTAIDPQPWF